MEEKIATFVSNIKKFGLIIGGVLLSIILAANLFEDVDAGEIVVIQSPVSGELSVTKQAGWTWQGGGKVTHYKKSNQFWFLSKELGGDGDQSLPAVWNDGGKSSISGSVRWDMPLIDKEIITLHSNFSSLENIEKSLVKTNIEKAIFLSGPLMSSKESYAERRSDLISLIEDQANKGVYRTRTMEKDIADPLTGQIKKTKVVEIININGLAQRQETSSIKANGLKLYNVAIKFIHYDADVEAQIKKQQQSIMAVQSSIANALKAEQDAITIAKQGEAEAAKAKWQQEVIKAQLVTEAESRNKVAELDVATAELKKKKDILEGEGIATKKRLVMQADGALDQKLQTYKEVSKYWADAFSNYQGSLVPQFMTGSASGGASNAGLNFMELMSAKTARDLSLDLSNKKG
jgi:regulator of protease activity HflC (stomatin/prohibitin superfamily)